ncbi:MAG TPA: hypothetical protein VMW68_05990 [Methyloceanibacter sp.]|nr:hypothetical protein [Methyloceanibacter sp.]
MLRTVLFTTLLAGTALAAASLFAVTPAKAEWLCAGDTCRWVAWDVDEPDFALGWPDPPRASCFWRQGILGRWKFICPNR